MMVIGGAVVFLSVYAKKPDSELFMVSAFFNPFGANLGRTTQILLRSCYLACDLYVHIVMVSFAVYVIAIFQLYIYCGSRWQDKSRYLAYFYINSFLFSSKLNSVPMFWEIYVDNWDRDNPWIGKSVSLKC